MRKETIKDVFALVLALASAAAAATTQTAGESGTGRWTFTFSERIRQESSDNVMSLDEGKADSSAYVRFRTSAGLKWTPSSALEFNVRLTNENRYYLAPKSDTRLGVNYGLNEVFFDWLFVKWSKPGRLPLTLTVGRQDIMLGEGFVIFDGGPLDGSRSAYFNGLRLDFLLAPQNTLTVFFVRQHQTDKLLPRLNDAGQRMVEQDEQGFGLYYAGTVLGLRTESYLFRKSASAAGALPAAAFQVLGARISAQLAPRWSLIGEGAGEFGSWAGSPMAAWGGYVHLNFAPAASFPMPGLLTLGGIYLSGDDNGTARHEGWDPAFSRWPKWSESLIYLQAVETGRPAYWTNMTSLYGEAVFDLASNARLKLTLHTLGAPRKTPAGGVCSGAGLHRGELFIARFSYDLNKNISGHFLWEGFRPGNFYFAGARSYAWIRFELMFRY